MITRPRDAFSPTSPQKLAGIRVDPPPSDDIDSGTTPAITDAAERTKGVFLATVSHELRTPLTAIVTGVKPEHRLYREEVFGPVLAVTPFQDEAEALQMNVRQRIPAPLRDKALATLAPLPVEYSSLCTKLWLACPGRASARDHSAE